MGDMLSSSGIVLIRFEAVGGKFSSFWMSIESVVVWMLTISLAHRSSWVMPVCCLGALDSCEPDVSECVFLSRMSVSFLSRKAILYMAGVLAEWCARLTGVPFSDICTLWWCFLVLGELVSCTSLSIISFERSISLLVELLLRLLCLLKLLSVSLLLLLLLQPLVELASFNESNMFARFCSVSSNMFLAMAFSRFNLPRLRLPLRFWFNTSTLKSFFLSISSSSNLIFDNMFNLQIQFNPK